MASVTTGAFCETWGSWSSPPTCSAAPDGKLEQGRPDHVEDQVVEQQQDPGSEGHNGEEQLIRCLVSALFNAPQAKPLAATYEKSSEPELDCGETVGEDGPETHVCDDDDCSVEMMAISLQTVFDEDGW